MPRSLILSKNENLKLPNQKWSGRESNPSHRLCKSQSPPWNMPPHFTSLSSPSWTRTNNHEVNSFGLYQLSYRGMKYDGESSTTNTSLGFAMIGPKGTQVSQLSFDPLSATNISVLFCLCPSQILKTNCLQWK